jgi:hypothetical protein
VVSRGRARGAARRPLSFLLFPVEFPEFFDAVVLDEADRVTRSR